jgi:hypothetical protein
MVNVGEEETALSPDLGETLVRLSATPSFNQTSLFKRGRREEPKKR